MATIETQFGVNGSASTEVHVYKGTTKLTAVTTTPSEGQFKMSINRVTNCTADISGSKVYLNSLTGNTGTVVIDITFPNGEVIQKYFTANKSVSTTAITDIVTRTSSLEQDLTGFKLTASETYTTKTDLTDISNQIADTNNRIDEAELKITSDAIINTVSSSFYTKTQTDNKLNVINSSISSIEQTAISLTSKVTTVENQNKKNTSTIATNSSQIQQLSTEINSKVTSGDVQSIITQSPSQVQVAFNNISSNVQNSNGSLNIKNGMFKIYDSHNRNTFYVDTSGLCCTDRGYASYNTDGTGVHILGNVIYHVPPASGSTTYQQLHIESDKAIAFKTASDAMGGQGAYYQQIVTSGLILDGKIWNGTGDTGYILTSDYGMWKVKFYNQHADSLIDIEAQGATFENLNVTGSKNRVVETEHYGKIKMNALETADCIFEDRGRGTIVNGKCTINIDAIFAETVDISDYDVFITKYGRGDIWVSERTETYFVVEADNDIPFAYSISAKQKGFENTRMESFKEKTSMTDAQKFLLKNNLPHDYLKTHQAWEIYKANDSQQ